MAVILKLLIVSTFLFSVYSSVLPRTSSKTITISISFTGETNECDDNCTAALKQKRQEFCSSVKVGDCASKWVKDTAFQKAETVRSACQAKCIKDYPEGYFYNRKEERKPY